MGGAASAMAEVEQMVACTFLLGQAISRAYPQIYNVTHFATPAYQKKMEREHDKQMEEMQKSVPMMFVGKDGTVQAINFVDKDGNAPGQSSNEDDDLKSEEEDENIPEIECLVVDFQEQRVPIPLATIGNENDDGWTVLHACAHHPSMSDAAKEIIHIYTLNGYSLDTKTRRGPGSYATEWTPLQMACAYGVTKTALALIDAGADIHVTNSTGWTPLYEAVHRGYTDIAKALIAKGARFDQCIPSNTIAPYHPQRPLAHAARSGHIDIVRELLENGADKDAGNDGGWTALHEAVFFRQENIVELLLEHGCDISRKTRNGYSVMDFESAPEIRKRLEAVAKRNFDGLLIPDTAREEKQEPAAKGKLEYRLLGELPEFKPTSFMQKLNAPSGPEVEDADEDAEEQRLRIEERKRLRRARKEQQGQGKRNSVHLQSIATPEPGIPADYACQLSGKLLSDPVTTIYGNHFEKSAVLAWIKSQGNICPVTGQPLGESDCVIDRDLRIEICDWQLKQSLKLTDTTQPDVQAVPADGDLYDF